jgi:hypothetical protein
MELESAKPPSRGKMKVHGINRLPTVRSYNRRQRKHPRIHSVAPQTAVLQYSNTPTLQYSGAP